MKVESNRQGGLTLELDREEAVLFRHVVERAAFIDTPPGRQHSILRLAERILAAIPTAGDSSDRV